MKSAKVIMLKTPRKRPYEFNSYGYIPLLTIVKNVIVKPLLIQFEFINQHSSIVQVNRVTKVIKESISVSRFYQRVTSDWKRLHTINTRQCAWHYRVSIIIYVWTSTNRYTMIVTFAGDTAILAIEETLKEVTNINNRQKVV